MRKLLLIFLITNIAQASLLIEPYLGLNLNGEWSAQDADSSDEFDGTARGARLGIQKLGLMLGVDYRQRYWLLDDSAKTKLNGDQFAAFIGYDFPIFFRIYGEYVFGGEAKDQDGVRYLGASGFVVGLGYKFFPFLSLNLERGELRYHEVELTNGVNLEEREEAASYYLLSVSVPINLGM